jgi:hypothetical protein
MTDTNDTSITTALAQQTRLNEHKEIADRITGYLMRYRSFSDPESWRQFSTAQICVVLDAARRRR